MTNFKKQFKLQKNNLKYLSLSINGANKNVKIGVQNIIADAFPRGTIFTALNMAAKRSPPNKPWATVLNRTSFGPKKMSIFGSSWNENINDLTNDAIVMLLMKKSLCFKHRLSAVYYN